MEGAAGRHGGGWVLLLLLGGGDIVPREVCVIAQFPVKAISIELAKMRIGVTNLGLMR